jgi:D-alanyl-D-alanine carboxypeptidase/D-alanyl-D-alanine-endopeptidase (penicillin-binding protein 4)
VLVAALLVPSLATGQSLARRIGAIMARPEFTRSYFGMAFVDLATGKPVYRYNADKFFVPGSTTKVPTAASALQLLGADYRFHTRIYRTGPIVNGVLEGDLVLVASGDPNLSGRLRPDGSLAFTNEDHSYGNMPEDLVDGDPLVPFRGLVAQVKATGIRRVAGRVIVDGSLFPEGDREGGTNVVISPMVLNDNLIDVVVVPGERDGAPTTLRPTVPSS